MQNPRRGEWSHGAEGRRRAHLVDFPFDAGALNYTHVARHRTQMHLDDRRETQYRGRSNAASTECKVSSSARDARYRWQLCYFEAGWNFRER